MMNDVARHLLQSVKILVLMLLVTMGSQTGWTQDPSAEVSDSEVVDEYAEALKETITPAVARFVGKAYDAKTGKPLEGAGIMVEGIGATLTDSKGRFIIDQVPPGTYNITISQSGFEPVSVTGVVMQAGEVTNLADAQGALERRLSW